MSSDRSRIGDDRQMPLAAPDPAGSADSHEGARRTEPAGDASSPAHASTAESRRAGRTKSLRQDQASTRPRDRSRSSRDDGSSRTSPNGFESDPWPSPPLRAAISDVVSWPRGIVPRQPRPRPTRARQRLDGWLRMTTPPARSVIRVSRPDSRRRSADLLA
jgi:hypothetical protein